MKKHLSINTPLKHRNPVFPMKNACKSTAITGKTAVENLDKMGINILKISCFHREKQQKTGNSLLV